MADDTVYMQNREISWLRFNERVLHEAKQTEVSAYEKLKFISIFSSNLDEFFMVRVGSLHDLARLKKVQMDNKTNMTPADQINAVLDMLPDMYKEKDRLFKQVNDDLNEYGIYFLEYEQANDIQKQHIDDYFQKSIMPLLSAQIIDQQHPFPFLENKHLYIITHMLDSTGETIFGFIHIRPDFDQFYLIPGDEFAYIMTEKIILNHAETLFKNYKVLNKNIIAVTRNFDLDADTDILDEFDDYKNHMRKVIKLRTRQGVVRLEHNGAMCKELRDFLLQNIRLKKNSLFLTSTPINMKYVFSLLDFMPSAKKEKILFPEFTRYRKLMSYKKTTLFELIESKDMLLSYPYDDVEDFLDLIKEAAENPDVLSIKITIYRLAKNSKMVKYLVNAVENGKEVTVFMELKARFDEASNINYSEILSQSGCNIFYGVENYKIHSKVCLITYRDKMRNLKFITQIGTGNYNESTSRQYADLSLITADKGIGLDANDFFKYISTANLNGKYEYLAQSPTSLKSKFMRLIDEEIKKGKNGRLIFKMNSLTDRDFIEKLSEASQAEVEITLIIRGICCILPHIKGKSESINIMSIVGRFLEHARIYMFGKGEDMKMYISSADLMTRNTERRIEIACPIFDFDIQKEITEYVEAQLKDNVKGRKMNCNGQYEKILDGKEPFNSQEYFVKLKSDAEHRRIHEYTSETETMNEIEIKEKTPTATKKVSIFKKIFSKK